MKARALVPTMLAVIGAFSAAKGLELVPEVAEFEAFLNGDIFDNDAVQNVLVVDGKVALAGSTPEKKGANANRDSVGDQLVELTDGSQLHGQLESLGKSGFIWKRSDTPEPLVFSPQDVQRVTLAAAAAAPQPHSNATLKLRDSDWITGDLTGYQNGAFHLELDGAGPLEIPRSQVEWLYLTKDHPPDAYEGPLGPMGLAGWETGGAPGSSPWDYADGALAARAALPLTRSFGFLPEKMDLEFSASDGGNAIRGLTLWLQPGAQLRGYSKGSVYLRFQGNNISANSYDGNSMKNFTATIPENKKPPKETRYRLLHDKRSGKLIIFVNGVKVADWDLQKLSEPSQGGSMSWQPTYWSSNMPWTLSKVRVRPWDGTVDAEPNNAEATKDVLTAAGDARLVGSLDSISKDTVKIGGKDFARGDASIFIRLAPAPPSDPPPSPAARVWLSQRGEFDVNALGIRDGQLTVRTSFAGPLSLPLTAIRAIEFPHRISGADRNIADSGDTLIFRNSDELRGTLVSLSQNQSVKWKPVKGDRTVDFGVDRIAGILLAKAARPAQTSGNAAVRFRNGDWLQGQMLMIGKDHVRFKPPISGPLQLARASVQGLYFGQDGEVPVWDGTSERQLWMKSASPDGRSRQRRDDVDRRNPWRYLDGSFTLPKSTGRGGYSSGPNIGRTLDALPEKVEVRFDLSTPDGSASYSVQLFSEENRQGLMIQGSWDSAYIYDMSPRRQGGGFSQPQQVDFGEEVGSDGNRRQFRFLADRKTGRFTMIVNGVPVAQFGQRAGKESAKPGRGIAIIPQQMNSSVTVSNVWIGPWTGEPPAIPKPGAKPKKQEPEPEKPPANETSENTPATKAEPMDLIALVNGDESTGRLEKATESDISLKCDAGTIDIPVNRTLMVEFAGAPSRPAEGIRLHLAGKGTITVDSLDIADGRITCRSASMGDLQFNSDQISEIVFQPRNEPPPERDATQTSGDAAPSSGGALIIRGNGILQLNNGAGGIIINR